MQTPSACLIDLYETLVVADFRPILPAVATAAGVDAESFTAAVLPWMPLLGDGRATLAEAYDAALRTLGEAPTSEQLAALVAVDREELAKATRLPDDTIPFLEALRARGVRTAVVSNCMENSRDHLEVLGIAGLVDELVLSCEVGTAKPDPGIFTVALDRLGVSARDAVFVDDQQTYLDGAATIGVRGVRIDRSGSGAGVPGLAGIVPLFDALTPRAAS